MDYKKPIFLHQESTSEASIPSPTSLDTSVLIIIKTYFLPYEKPIALFIQIILKQFKECQVLPKIKTKLN